MEQPIAAFIIVIATFLITGIRWRQEMDRDYVTRLEKEKTAAEQERDTWKRRAEDAEWRLAQNERRRE